MPELSRPDLSIWYGDVRRTIAFLTRRRCDLSQVDELTQVTFERALANENYDPSRPARPWLLAIARNVVFEESRRSQRQPLRLVDADDQVSPEARIAELDPRLELGPDLDRRLAWLERYCDQHEDDWAVIVLVEFEGLSYSEVGEALGVSRQQAYHRHQSAIRALHAAWRRDRMPPPPPFAKAQARRAEITSLCPVAMALATPHFVKLIRPRPPLATRALRWTAAVTAAVAALWIVLREAPLPAPAAVTSPSASAETRPAASSIETPIAAPNERVAPPASPRPAERSVRRSQARSAEAPRSTPLATDEPAPTEDEELALVERIERHARAGALAEARAAIEAHRRRFPAGSMVEHREAWAVLVLAAAGDPAAAAAGERFNASHPASVYRRRVELAVGLAPRSTTRTISSTRSLP